MAGRIGFETYVNAVSSRNPAGTLSGEQTALKHGKMALSLKTGGAGVECTCFLSLKQNLLML